jgi:hypothetical protein
MLLDSSTLVFVALAMVASCSPASSGNTMKARDARVSQPPAPGDGGVIPAADASNDESLKTKQLEGLMNSSEFCGFMPLDMGGPLPCGARTADAERRTCIAPFANEDAPDALIELFRQSSVREASGDCARLTGVPLASLGSGLSALRARGRAMHGRCGLHHCGTRSCELRVVGGSGQPEVVLTFDASAGAIAALSCSVTADR